MSATVQFCQNQVLRLSGLPNFPTARPAANELVAALLRHSLNDQHAQTIVTELLDTSKWAPTPADIRQMGLDTRDAFLPKAKAGCKRCNGTGYTVAPYLITWSSDHRHKAAEKITPEQAANLRGRLTRTQDIAEAAARCDCLEEIIANMPPEPPPKRSSNRSGRMRQAGDMESGAL